MGDNITYNFSPGEFIFLLKNINSQIDTKNIANTYTLSKNAHAGQFRENKEPYFNHPIEVAYLSALAGADSTTIKAALLHDVVEDTDTSLNIILPYQEPNSFTPVLENIWRLLWGEIV